MISTTFIWIIFLESAFGDHRGIPFFSDTLYIVMSNHFTHYLKYRQKEDKLLTKV